MVRSERDVYFDALRVIAIIRVVAYHLCYAGWLAVIFPSMGIMFALGGHLAAQSVSRRGPTMVKQRLLRVLHSFWALGAVLVPLSIIGAATTGASTALTAQNAFAWILPFTDPKGLVGIDSAWRPLWYLRAYLWFILLTPLLSYVVRRAPLPTIAAVLGVTLIVPGSAVPLLYDANQFGPVIVDLLTYGACWTIGMAAFHGALQQLPRLAVLGAALVLGGEGARQLLEHASEVGRLELYGAPASANALWSCAFVLVLLRFRPGASQLAKIKAAAPLLRRFSSRSLTIYLWHGLAIVAAKLVLDRPFLQPVVMSPWTPGVSIWLGALTVAAIAVVALTAGRLEDNRRRPANQSL